MSDVRRQSAKGRQRAQRHHTGGKPYWSHTPKCVGSALNPPDDRAGTRQTNATLSLLKAGVIFANKRALQSPAVRRKVEPERMRRDVAGCSPGGPSKRRSVDGAPTTGELQPPARPGPVPCRCISGRRWRRGTGLHGRLLYSVAVERFAALAAETSLVACRNGVTMGTKCKTLHHHLVYPDKLKTNQLARCIRC
jgi:hypothetical protein